MMRFRFKTSTGLAAATLCLSACAATQYSAGGTPASVWAATGCLAPVCGPEEAGETIGAFDTQDACEAAVDDWLARQVAGTAISGACERVPLSTE